MNDQQRFSRLILASGSAARRALLGRLGMDFDVIPADIDETPESGEEPERLVERLSRDKAGVIATIHPDAIVIGSDQVALFKGNILGKPGTPERAHANLRSFSGQEVKFLTGLCVIAPDSDYSAYHADETRVRFRELTDRDIERYVERDDPLACAGSFKVESLGPVLFESVISTDPTALQGLPLIRLSAMLRDAGLRLP